MKTLLLSALLLFPALTALAQSDPVVMTVNGVPVPRSEFGEGVIDKKTVEEYVELFVNYKLKVAAALDAKLDTAASFKEEYAMYRDQQVLPTMVSDVDVQAEAQQMYNRLKESIGTKGLVRPAHILLGLSTQATSSEQDKCRQRIDSVYMALQDGADFAELARRLSQDPGSAVNGGELPWIAPGQTLKEFEDVAYALQPGEMSRPFLTPMGYHIILMKERKQLEPFDSLKTTMVSYLERRGIREEILRNRLKYMVDESKDQLTTNQILEKRSDSLALVDNDMKYLFKEYHDGLLLYEISNREVWEKATADETALQTWFATHRNNYVWEQPRYKGIAYHVKTKQDVKAVKKCVKRLPFDQWAEALRTTFNPDTVIRIRVEKALFKQGDNPTIDRMVFKVASAQLSENKDYPIDAVYGKKLKKPEDYTDVKNQVIEDYQDMLEQEWVAALRKRYPVEIDEAVLKTVNRHS